MNHENYMYHAEIVSMKSPDPSTKVGAAIVLSDGSVLVGYNNFPKGVIGSEERWKNRSEKYPRVVHAEANVLISCSRMLRIKEPSIGFDTATLYTTEFPCCSCCGLIIQYGIKKVVSKDLSSSYAERWAEDIEISKSMFRESGVELIIIPR